MQQLGIQPFASPSLAALAGVASEVRQDLDLSDAADPFRDSVAEDLQRQQSAAVAELSQLWADLDHADKRKRLSAYNGIEALQADERRFRLIPGKLWIQIFADPEYLRTSAEYKAANAA